MQKILLFSILLTFSTFTFSQNTPNTSESILTGYSWLVHSSTKLKSLTIKDEKTYSKEMLDKLLEPLAPYYICVAKDLVVELTEQSKLSCENTFLKINHNNNSNQFELTSNCGMFNTAIHIKKIHDHSYIGVMSGEINTESYLAKVSGDISFVKTKELCELENIAE